MYYIEMKDIVKTYGNVVANNKVSFGLKEGEILAVIGENGAGKSTIMKILYGLETADSGEIFLNGNKVNFKNPKDAIKNGIGMVQQHFMLFQEMKVFENIMYNQEISKKGILDIEENIKRVEELAFKYNLKIDPRQIVSDTSVGTQQRIEILKTLYQNANVIIFDEPSAVLTPVEVEELVKTLKDLAKLGKSIVIITHKLQEVMDCADRVVVMRSGEVVHETNIENTNIEELSYHMIGRLIIDKETTKLDTRETVLSVENLNLKDEFGKYILKDVSLNVKRGEIVGIAGVSGNGQSELIKSITGLINEYNGNVFVDNNNVSNKDVHTIRKAGLAHISEDRYFYGSAKQATLKENVLMGYEDSPEFSSKGILKHKKIDEFTKELISKYGVKASSINQKIKELSGGNAQKLIAAREIEMHTPLLIACEPTRGIDIGAMEFIHDKLLEKRNEMDGILLMSSELSEILKLSDRIYVMYEGRICHEFVRGEVDERNLGIVMTGGEINE